ncbi:hypothetical protein T4B_15341 [Trichinella pseudospiralis]|uniref:Uncharacterized protein n=1 Tax=Trichinella pseudospiralis TaxID=6337 RepID=A0A0V1GA44_TRIPS|nr:hypothetical protein T4B_15341 [Trichinella pseudospiralis]KRY96348.1 hypothetical protein T4C_7938 [Trichinella pseudospiralis]
MSIFEKNAFSRKFQNFLNYRQACFAKNGEKLFFTNFNPYYPVVPE